MGIYQAIVARLPRKKERSNVACDDVDIIYDNVSPAVKVIVRRPLGKL